ncbi:MAG TPA: OmpA family protein [Microthrixaceae bacterium]|nr:OmpA family protein [Microthrixaceae bacterium]
MRKRRSHSDDDHEEHVNHEAWVIPYADMLTLLMGLFLVLWAIGNEDLAKMKEFSESFRSEVGIVQNSGPGAGPGDGAGPASPAAVKPDPALTDAEIRKAGEVLDREAAAIAVAEDERRQLTTAETIIRDRASAAGVNDAISFRREDRGLIVSIVSDDVLFAPGSADLRTDGQVALDVLAGALNELPNKISIEGHTDDIPISSSKFPSNWELSTARAGAVLRYLVDSHELDKTRLVAGGYAEQRPLKPNDSVEGRARNRRVDIAVLSSVGGKEVSGG